MGVTGHGDRTRGVYGIIFAFADMGGFETRLSGPGFGQASRLPSLPQHRCAGGFGWLWQSRNILGTRGPVTAFGARTPRTASCESAVA